MPGPGGPAACSESSGGIVSEPLADITVIEVDNYMAAPSA